MVFTIGGLLVGVFGGASIAAIPVVLMGILAGLSALDAALFLSVKVRDGEISFNGQRIRADAVSSVSVCAWRHVGKIRMSPGVAVVITANGRRYHTGLCYEDHVDALAVAHYLAGFLSAELSSEDSDVVVTTDFPAFGEVIGRFWSAISSPKIRVPELGDGKGESSHS